MVPCSLLRCLRIFRGVQSACVFDRRRRMMLHVAADMVVGPA